MPADFILLENDRFAAFARLPGRPLLRLAWTDKTIELSHEQYKAIVRRWLELIAEHAADRLLIDTSAHTFTITPDLMAQGVAFSVLMGILGGFFPAWRASRIPVTEAMKGG